MAEGQGFEPWEPLDSSVFKTGAFDHSATPPKLYRGLPRQGVSKFTLLWVYCPLKRKAKLYISPLSYQVIIALNRAFLQLQQAVRFVLCADHSLGA